MVPFKRFELIPIVVNSEISPKLEGRDSVSMFSYRLRVVNLIKQPRLDGMLPVNLFDES